MDNLKKYFLFEFSQPKHNYVVGMQKALSQWDSSFEHRQHMIKILVGETNQIF